MTADDAERLRPLEGISHYVDSLREEGRPCRTPPAAQSSGMEAGRRQAQARASLGVPRPRNEQLRPV